MFYVNSQPNEDVPGISQIRKPVNNIGPQGNTILVQQKFTFRKTRNLGSWAVTSCISTTSGLGTNCRETNNTNLHYRKAS